MTNDHFTCENLRNWQWPFYLWKISDIAVQCSRNHQHRDMILWKNTIFPSLVNIEWGLVQIYDILWCLVIWHWANELLFQNSWIPCGQSIESLYFTDPTWLCLISSCVSKFPFSKYALTDLTLLMGIGFLVTCCRQILSRGPFICDTIFMFLCRGTHSTN